MGQMLNIKYICLGGLKFNEDEKEELEVSKLSDTYYSVFALDKYGYPVTLKILAINDFGKQYSDDIVIKITMENSSDMFKDILSYIDECLYNLYN